MVLNPQRITENDNMILLQNEDWIFIMRLLEGEIPPLQNDDWFLSSSYLKGTLRHYKMKIGFYMLLSSGYLKGKLQYPSCGYKMPDPSPFFHLNLCLERP